MLTIQSGINRNLYSNPTFAAKKCENQERLTKQEWIAKQRAEERERLSEERLLNKEYNEATRPWEEQQSTFDQIQSATDAIPKPIKTAAKVGSIGVAAVLGGMATGWSASYMITAFKKMGASKQAQNLSKSFKKHVSQPVSKGWTALKTAVTKQIGAIKAGETYKSTAKKIATSYENFKTSKFSVSVKNIFGKIKNNKVVKAVTGAIDKVLDFFAGGIVKIYNKISSIGAKNLIVDTASVAGGVSTGAVAVIDSKKENKEVEDGGEE